MSGASTQAHLAYARDGDPQALGGLLAALTTLAQAVGRSGNAREKVPLRRPPSAGEFLLKLADAESRELRIAVGLASCATLPGLDQVRTPARAMRQILLPVDPPGPSERARSAGRWRDTPLVPGLGARPLPQVLAAVLAWRSRTAADEHSRQHYRGVPAFRSGLGVPAADLHAFALDLVDSAALEFWLRACLALDWRGVDWRGDAWPWRQAGWAWPGSDPMLVPTLGLLHPLANGMRPPGGYGDAPRLALRPDWANRLAAGQAIAVHNEAVAVLRQVGWDAVPAPPEPPDGVLIAAALVARCHRSGAVLNRLATLLREPDDAALAQAPELLPSPN